MTVDAYPDRPFQGTVEKIERQVALTNDAVKTLREASTAALLVGLDPDSVSAMVREQQAAMRGTGNGNATNDAAPRQAVAMDSGRGKGVSPLSSSIRARTALVFVEIAAGKYEPRIVRLGAANYDYSEVISGAP